MTGDPAVDRALVARIRAGDRAAFERVFRMHHKSLLGFAVGQLRDRSAAEDVIQDVFLRMWRGRRDISVSGSLRNYLFAAVRNRVIDHARRRATERRVFELHAVFDDAASVSAAAGRDLGDPAELAELGEAIRRTIAALPERCRTAFLLCREQDLTYQDAADVMGVSPSTIKTQVARALRALRSALEPLLVLMAAVVPPPL